MSFTCSLVRVIQHFCTIQSGELCWCDGLIKILNWDQDPERAAAANWGMVEAGGGSGAYSSLGKLEALRNNGMWVYLSPQINGTHGSANYLSDCGQYQAVQMNVVFTVFICLVFIQPVLHVVSQFSDGLKKWVSYIDIIILGIAWHAFITSSSHELKTLLAKVCFIIRKRNLEY